MKNFGTHSDCITKSRSTNRHNHKFLKIDRIIGMRTTIDNIHHRNRQSVGINTTHITIKILTGFLSSSISHSQRNTQNSIGTQIRFIRSSIQFNHSVINRNLIGNIHTFQFFINCFINILNSFQHTFTKIQRFIIISKLTSFVNTCRSPRRNSRTSNNTIISNYFNFNSRITS